jgi:hypothetical protein
MNKEAGEDRTTSINHLAALQQTIFRRNRVVFQKFVSFIQTHYSIANMPPPLVGPPQKKKKF